MNAPSPTDRAEALTDGDIAEAEATYEAFAERFGMAHDRAVYIAALARAGTQKRLQSEHKAKFEWRAYRPRKVA